MQIDEGSANPIMNRKYWFGQNLPRYCGAQEARQSRREGSPKEDE